MGKQTGRSSDDPKHSKKSQTTTKTNFATKGLMPESAEGTAKSRRGGGIAGTVAELKNALKGRKQ